MHKNWKLYFWLWNRANKRIFQESESWILKKKTIYSGKAENKVLSKQLIFGVIFLDFNKLFYLLSVDKIRISDEDDLESDKR